MVIPMFPHLGRKDPWAEEPNKVLVWSHDEYWQTWRVDPSTIRKITPEEMKLERKKRNTKSATLYEGTTGSSWIKGSFLRNLRNMAVITIEEDECVLGTMIDQGSSIDAT